MTEFSHYQPDILAPEDKQILLDAIDEKLITEHRDAHYTDELRTYAADIISEGTEQQAAAVAEILLENTLHGNEIPEIMGKYNFVDEYDKKQQFIGIAVHDPELAHAMVANSVSGFHASNSSSLLGVLEHGLLASAESRRRGVALGSGERTYTNPNARPFISFADWRDPHTISEYANGGQELPTNISIYKEGIKQLRKGAAESAADFGPTHPFAVNAELAAQDSERIVSILEDAPDSLQAELITANFPVVYGFDTSGYDQISSSIGLGEVPHDKTVLSRCLARSQYGSEFAVFGDVVPVEDLPIIAVPEGRVDMVRELVKQSGHGIDVYPIENLLVAHGKPERPKY